MPDFKEIQLEIRKLEAKSTLPKASFDSKIQKTLFLKEFLLLILTNQNKALRVILTNKNKALFIKMKQSLRNFWESVFYVQLQDSLISSLISN